MVIHSDNWSDHIRQIKRFFQIMQEAKLTINLMKSEFGKATVKNLGHIVGQGQVRPSDAKIQTIAKFPIPTSWKELARFLGMQDITGNLSGQMIVNWLLTKLSYYSKNPLF